MNEQKKFVIKKTPSFLRAKISSNDELLFQNQTNGIGGNPNTQDQLQNFTIEGILFTANTQKIIKKHTSQKFPSEIFMARYSLDDSKIATTFLDGSISIINTKDPNKSFTHQINDSCPITSVVWKDNKNFIVGDTEGFLYDVEYSKN